MMKIGDPLYDKILDPWLTHISSLFSTHSITYVRHRTNYHSKNI